MLDSGCSVNPALQDGNLMVCFVERAYYFEVFSSTSERRPPFARAIWLSRSSIEYTRVYREFRVSSRWEEIIIVDVVPSCDRSGEHISVFGSFEVEICSALQMSLSSLYLTWTRFLAWFG